MAQIYVGYYLLSIKGGTVALAIPALLQIWTKFLISRALVFFVTVVCMVTKNENKMY
jgi:hypothetical protein